MHEIFTFLLIISAKMGYWGIILLMSIESSFIPLPSELVIPPAAYLASQGQMNIYLVIISGTIGSMIGATFNYFLALTLGRKIIYALANHKISKFLLINKQKVENAEKYFLQKGNISTFIGRLVPAVRHLISIPAGLAKMNLRDFWLFTFLGSGLWMIILAFLGYTFGANQDIVMKYYEEIKYFLILVFVVLLGYFVWSKMKDKAN